jgi:hypothetical protein
MRILPHWTETENSEMPLDSLIKINVAVPGCDAVFRATGGPTGDQGFFWSRVSVALIRSMRASAKALKSLAVKRSISIKFVERP